MNRLLNPAINRRKKILAFLVLLAAAAVAAAAVVLVLRDSVVPAAGHGPEAHHDHAEDHGDHGDHDGEDPAALRIGDEVLRESGVAWDTVRTRRMAVRLPLLGRIALNGNRTAHIHPRFPGVITEVRKQLGARVRKGDVLAMIESNESLRPYPVVARLDGAVVGRHAAVGESVDGEDELFTVADLSTVWVDFEVYRRDFHRLRVGQAVRVIADGLPETLSAEVRLAYLAPRTEVHSQTQLARANLPNDRGLWTPGLFVQGEAELEPFTAPAVRRDAVQELEGRPVVFVREEAGRHRPVPVTLGRRDGDYVELLSGPGPGAVYVSGNSFLLKADLGKGEASHEH